MTEWAAYEKVYGPLGARRSDLQTGIIAATIANAFSTGKKKRAKPKDFVPEWDQKPQTAEEQLATVYHLNRAFGGSVKGVSGDDDR